MSDGVQSRLREEGGMQRYERDSSVLDMYLKGIPIHASAGNTRNTLSGGSLETINALIISSALDALSGFWKSTSQKLSRNGKN